MTTRDWLKALDASCSESFFVRTPDGGLAGREIEDWDGIGLEVDLGEPGWLEDDGSDCGSEGFGADPEVNAANVDDRWQQEQQPPAGHVAEHGRRQRRRAGEAAPRDAAAPRDQHATMKHLLGHEVTYVSIWVVRGTIACLRLHTVRLKLQVWVTSTCCLLWAYTHKSGTFTSMHVQ